MADNNNPATEVASAAKSDEKDSNSKQAAPAITPEIARKLRDLKIKTGTVKRLTKDKVCYIKEAEEQEKKIQKFKDEGKEELFIKQQEGNLKETHMMIPDIGRLLTNAYQTLKTIVDAEKDELGSFEDYKVALQVLGEAEPHIVRTLNAAT